MPNPVKNYTQEKYSTLAVTATPRHGAEHFTFHFSDYSFEEFSQFCQRLNAKAIHISTAKQNQEIRIQLFIDKKKAYFGRGNTFAKALQKLLADMQPPTLIC